MDERTRHQGRIPSIISHNPSVSKSPPSYISWYSSFSSLIWDTLYSIDSSKTIDNFPEGLELQLVVYFLKSTIHSYVTTWVRGSVVVSGGIEVRLHAIIPSLFPEGSDWLHNNTNIIIMEAGKLLTPTALASTTLPLTLASHGFLPLLSTTNF